MAQIPWRPEFETGIKDIDYEHRTLIEAINALITDLQGDVSRAQADAFALAASTALGLPAQVTPYEKTDKWQTALTRHMPPEHALLNSLEQQISGLARQHGGEADGWGCPPVSGDSGLR